MNSLLCSTEKTLLFGEMILRMAAAALAVVHIGLLLLIAVEVAAARSKFRHSSKGNGEKKERIREKERQTEREEFRLGALTALNVRTYVHTYVQLCLQCNIYRD